MIHSELKQQDACDSSEQRLVEIGAVIFFSYTQLLMRTRGKNKSMALKVLVDLLEGF